MKKELKRLLFRLETKWKKLREGRKKKSDKPLPAHLQSGRKGERYAAEYMEKKGFRIVARNYAVGKSEIDFVAENEELFVFCEVKARIQTYGVPTRYGPPSRAVTREKRRHLLPAASLFCRKHKAADKPFRFDVIEIYLNDDLSLGYVNHYENLLMK